MEETENMILDQLFNEEDGDDMQFLFSSTSEDSSDSELNTEEDDTDSSIENKIKPRRNHVKCSNYVEDVVQRYDDITFREHFRMSRTTFQHVLIKIVDANIVPHHTFGRPKVSSEKAFLMTLWYLANKETYRQISDRFNVTRSTAHRYIKLIIKFLVDISSQYIKWPQARDAEEIVAEFASFQNINGIVGAIDGCHINILRPNSDQEAYCNRKGDHSILLQGICDHSKRFIDVFCGEAGSIHDARLLKRSKIYEMISAGNFISNNYFLLGDSAYPSLPWLVPPFKDNGTLTKNHRIFNYKHSSSRMVIENAFGLLKGRFRRLKLFENLNIQFITQSVVAACVLHNICINFDDLEIEYEPEMNDTFDYQQEYENFEENFDRRQFIFNEMFTT